MSKQAAEKPSRIAPVEAGRKIQLPEEWAADLGIGDVVLLEKTEAGILARPRRAVSWDEIFAQKLAPPQPPAALDLSEVSGDDLLL